MTPTALILDFGGVLTTDLWESIRDFTRHCGLPADAILDLIGTDPDTRALYVGLERGEVSQPDFEQHLAARLGIPAAGLLVGLAAGLRPDEAMLDAVAALRAHGTRVAVLSNSWGSGPLVDPYDGYQLDARADVIVISDQVGLRKPEPAIFQLTVDKLGVPPTECVFVDDIAANLEPARDMGMHVIHHTATRTTTAALGRLFGTP